MKRKREPAPELTADDIVGDPKFAHYIASHMRDDGGPGVWLTCDRPFEESATDLLRSAIHAKRVAPSVLGDHRRPLKSRRLPASAPAAPVSQPVS